MSFSHRILFITIAILVIVTCYTNASLPIKVSSPDTHIRIEGGELAVSLQKDPFNIDILDALTGDVLLSGYKTDNTGSNIHLGQFLGFFLNIYEGYLFQFGTNTYTQYSTHIRSFSTPDMYSIQLTIDTTKSLLVPNHTLVLTLSDFQERQFKLFASFNGHLVNVSPKDLTFPVLGMNFFTPECEGFFGFGQRWNKVR